MSMARSPEWRAMRAEDLPGVVAVAAQAHPDFFESPEVFAEKFALFPRGCCALGDSGALLGYAIAHPWRGPPPKLNTFLHDLPQMPDHLYVHDLALGRGARGRGAGAAVTPRLVACARAEGLAALELVAIGDAAGFWARQGFLAEPDGAPAEYGPGAQRMRLSLRG